MLFAFPVRCRVLALMHSPPLPVLRFEQLFHSVVHQRLLAAFHSQLSFVPLQMKVSH